MDTQWDDDRIRATVRERSSKSPITGLDEVGWIVQLHDLGPADGRSAKPVLVFDSESTHGSAGVFHDDQTAQAFADRRRAAELRCQREIEAERHRRKEELSERQRDLWAEQARQKEIAKEANKAAKAADDLARKLAEEAANPTIAISCNPAEDGWSLWVAPCWTEGTQDGDPRQLVMEGMGLLGPRKLTDDKAPAKGKRSGKDPAVAQAFYDREAEQAGPQHPADQPKRTPPKRKAKPAAPPPEHVAESAGLPIGLGSRVQISVQDGSGGWTDVEGDIVKIGALDPSGVHMVEIEDGNGLPYDALATECTRVATGEEPTEGWDDPEAA
jgi:hypothetical protein